MNFNNKDECHVSLGQSRSHVTSLESLTVGTIQKSFILKVYGQMTGYGPQIVQFIYKSKQ